MGAPRPTLALLFLLILLHLKLQWPTCRINCPSKCLQTPSKTRLRSACEVPVKRLRSACKAPAKVPVKCGACLLSACTALQLHSSERVYPKNIRQDVYHARPPGPPAPRHRRSRASCVRAVPNPSPARLVFVSQHAPAAGECSSFGWGWRTGVAWAALMHSTGPAVGAARTQQPCNAARMTCNNSIHRTTYHARSTAQGRRVRRALRRYKALAGEVIARVSTNANMNGVVQVWHQPAPGTARTRPVQ